MAAAFSNEARGVFRTLPLEGIPGLPHHRPLTARADGEEVGLRTSPLRGLDVQLAMVEIEFAFELVYDQDKGMDNPFDQHADAFDYDYPTRLSGEPAGGIIDERQDLQFHPLEPLSARLMLTQAF